MDHDDESAVDAVRASDLLRLADAGAAYVHHVEELRTQVLRENPVLYWPRRGVQHRSIEGGGHHTTGWRADEIRYEHGALDTGEAVRSLGHWNPDNQVEVFEVIEGRVLMLAAPRGESQVLASIYAPGERCALPPGLFHVTYSPWEPSTVFNIYNTTGPRHDGDTKYLGEPAPRHTLVETAESWFLGVDAAPLGTGPRAWSLPDGVGSVTDVLIEASDEALLALFDRLTSPGPVAP